MKEVIFMALFNVNLMIRESRKAKGLTQEQLAEGICTRETIVRLENGRNKPNWFVYREIMLRLGLSQDFYTDEIASNDDVHLVRMFNKCKCFIATRHFEEAKAMLDVIEKEKGAPQGKGWTSSIGYYMYLYLKAGFYSLDTPEPGGNKYINPELSVACAMEAIKITRPDFLLDKIPDYFLASHEYYLINTVAIAYLAMDKKTEALHIWGKLKENTEKNYSEDLNDMSNKWYKMLLTNITIMLMKAELYEQCLQMADEGLANAKMEDPSITRFQNYIFCKAYSLLKLGREDEGRELYKKMLLFVHVIDGTWGLSFSSLKNDYEKEFGGQLDLSVAW